MPYNTFSAITCYSGCQLSTSEVTVIDSLNSHITYYLSIPKGLFYPHQMGELAESIGQ